MILPYSDSAERRSFPYVNLGLIAIACLAFAGQMAFAHWRNWTDPLMVLGVRPAAVVDSLRGAAVDWQVLTSPVTSMFTHVTLLHLAGNMLYLWIFGAHVEDVLGHRRYLGFYLVSGICATAAHVAFNANSPAPVVGASGAVSGVLAAYLLVFPLARVKVLIGVHWYCFARTAPAWLFLGLWFGWQVLMAAAFARTPGGGVAWFAHVGGFVAGLALVAGCGGRRLAGDREAVCSAWLDPAEDNRQGAPPWYKPQLESPAPAPQRVSPPEWPRYWDLPPGW